MAINAYQPTLSTSQGQFLSQGILLNAGSATAQQIGQFQPTAGMVSPPWIGQYQFYVTNLIFRAASATINNTVTVQVGWSNSVTSNNNVLSGSTALRGLAAGNFVSIPVTTSSTGPGSGLATAASVLTVAFINDLTGNGSVLCDVLGYFGQ